MIPLLLDFNSRLLPTYTPVVLTENTLFHISSLVFCRRVGDPLIPAMFAAPSNLPNSETISSNQESTCLVSVTSTTVQITFWPGKRNRVAVKSLSATLETSAKARDAPLE